MWMRERPAVEGWYWYADVYLVAIGFDPAQGLVPTLGYLRRVTYEETSWWEFGGRTLYSTTLAEGYWRPADVVVPPLPIAQEPPA